MTVKQIRRELWLALTAVNVGDIVFSLIVSQGGCWESAKEKGRTKTSKLVDEHMKLSY